MSKNPRLTFYYRGKFVVKNWRLVDARLSAGIKQGDVKGIGFKYSHYETLR